MISCEEVGEKDTRRHVNLQPDLYGFDTTAAISVNNDTMEEVRGRVCWSLRKADSTILASGHEDITIPPLSVVKLDEMDFNRTDVEHNHLTYFFDVDGQTVSSGSVLFTAPKHYQFEDPQLKCEVRGDEITVWAKSYAQSVQIDSPDSDFILSDNYFDMERGSRTVKILEGKPKTIRLRSVYDIR
jgi:beta-mannosidase